MNFINNTLSINKVKQTTIKSKILFSGVGIHNGKAVTMSIEPAKPDTGIGFKRIDIEHNNIIKALIINVNASKLCSTIKNENGISVSTIEHLMAALNGLNIDNVLVKLNSPELPALDGSSEEYTQKLLKSGIEIQKVNRNFLKILKKVYVKNNNRYISISPSNEFSLDIEINYPNTIIGNDKFLYTHKKTSFINDISKARTFAFAEDIEKMRAEGFAIGGSLNNAIVVDKNQIVNSTGLRLNNEFIKHKVLDCLGDFYLLGMPIIGKINCFAPGHEIDQDFIIEILRDKDNYTIENRNEYNDIRSYVNVSNNNTQSNKTFHVA